MGGSLVVPCESTSIAYCGEEVRVLINVINTSTEERLHDVEVMVDVGYFDVATPKIVSKTTHSIALLDPGVGSVIPVSFTLEEPVHYILRCLALSGQARRSHTKMFRFKCQMALSVTAKVCELSPSSLFVEAGIKNESHKSLLLDSVSMDLHEHYSSTLVKTWQPHPPPLMIKDSGLHLNPFKKLIWLEPEQTVSFLFSVVPRDPTSFDVNRAVDIGLVRAVWCGPLGEMGVQNSTLLERKANRSDNVYDDIGKEDSSSAEAILVGGYIQEGAGAALSTTSLINHFLYSLIVDSSSSSPYIAANTPSNLSNARESICGSIGILGVDRSKEKLIQALLMSNKSVFCLLNLDNGTSATILDTLASCVLRWGPAYCCQVCCKFSLEDSLAVKYLSVIPPGVVTGELRIEGGPSKTALMTATQTSRSASKFTNKNNKSAQEEAVEEGQQQQQNCDQVISSISPHAFFLNKLLLVGVNTKHLSELVAPIITSRTLSLLSLQRCNLLPNDALVIASMLAFNKSLSEVDLSENLLLADNGAIFIAVGLDANPHHLLKSLILKKCGIGELGALAICNHLEKRFHTPQDFLLDLGGNPAELFANKLLSKPVFQEKKCSREIKICLLGSGAVGAKSAMAVRFVQHCFCSEYDPTVEDSYRVELRVGDDVFVLHIIDTAGQEEYSLLRDQYIRHSEVFSLGYSITSRRSFADIKYLYERIRTIKDCKSPPIVLVGAKSDLDRQREVSKSEGEQLARELNCPFYEVSAKLNTNVDEVFFALVRETQKARLPPPSSSLQKKLSKLERLKDKIVPPMFPHKPCTVFSPVPRQDDLCDWRPLTSEYCCTVQPAPLPPQLPPHLMQQTVEPGKVTVPPPNNVPLASPHRHQSPPLPPPLTTSVENAPLTFDLQTADAEQTYNWLKSKGVEESCLKIIQAHKLRGRTLAHYTVQQLCALGIILGDAEFIVEELINNLNSSSSSSAATTTRNRRWTISSRASLCLKPPTRVSFLGTTAALAAKTTQTPPPPQHQPPRVDLAKALGGEELNYKCFAFVLGNATYCQCPLSNSLNDAEAVAQFLRNQCQFQVTQQMNVPNLQDFVCHLEDFKSNLKGTRKAGNKVATIFYFAGHGRQLKGHNFLLMTEDPAAFEEPNFEKMKHKAPMAGDILDGIKRHSDLVIGILDACRQSDDEDETRTRGFGSTTQLAKEDFPSGCIVIYPTSPGKTTGDTCKLPNRRNHGFFTGCLLEVLERSAPSTPFNDIMDETMVLVQSMSKGTQTPWLSKSVGHKFALF
ncbi:gtp-binding protein rit1 [Pelomyxa schiedti]|nr:gtp-binding protein rit1 [Pelomyxa schiedti]